MRIERKDVFGLILQIFLLMVSLILSSVFNHCDKSSYILWCRYGVIISTILFFMLYKQQNKLITGINIFFVVFVLFQFGIPIISAINPTYSSYYLRLFDHNILTSSAQFTVISIQLFTVGVYLNKGKKVTKISQSGNTLFVKINRKFNTNKRSVSGAAFLLFIFCAIFMLPLNGYAAIIAIKTMNAGLSIGASVRGIMSEFPLFKLIQQMFFPAGILFLCFSDSKSKRKIVEYLYLIVVALMLIVADRSSGISAFLVYGLLKFQKMENKKRNVTKYIYIAFIVLLVLITSIIIAQVRSNGEVQIQNIFFRIVEEMGFNFTSICFVQQYIPSVEGFKFGISYLAAIILVIPSTFDVFNLFPRISARLGETWLYNINNAIGREFLSFGVGFSLIAESYYNFGKFGCILMIFWGIAIARILYRSNSLEDSWGQYVNLAMMLALLTLPRRQFSFMLKAIEYDIIFMAIYIMLYMAMIRRKRR